MTPPEPMAPAFPAAWQRGVFALAVLAALALPQTLAALGRPTPRERLRSVPAAGGDFDSIERVILDEHGTIDVLVLGTSMLWSAIDTPYLQAQLRARDGRPVIARTIGSNFRGEDMTLLLLRETLRRRAVHTLILNMPSVEQRRDEPHPYAHRMAGPDFASLYRGLPWRYRIAAAGDAMVGAPRHALALLRPERGAPAVPDWPLGALLLRPETGAPNDASVAAPPPLLTAAELIDGPRSHDRFHVLGDPIAPAQLSLARETVALAHRHGIAVIIVHVPLLRERHRTTVDERMDWPRELPGIHLVGAPPAALFGAMTDARAAGFYFNGSHLDAAGARRLTEALWPALSELIR